MREGPEETDYKGFEEADIHKGLRAGGRVRSAIIIVRPANDPDDVRYVAYLRTSWRIGYHLFQLSRYRGERVYRDLGRLMFLLQHTFGVDSPIQVFLQGSPDLWRFRKLMSHHKGGQADDRAARPARVRRAPRTLEGGRSIEQSDASKPPNSSSPSQEPASSSDEVENFKE